MQLIQNLFFTKRKYAFTLLLLSFVVIICFAFSKTDDGDFDSARREVVLRRIGHEVLLQAGDSTSRVLPIKKIAENEYQISFEKEFTFQPDFLVKTTQRLLANEPFANDYVVNVLNCGDGSVAYSYAISKNKKDDIVTCIGRKQPKACYIIFIQFKPKGITTTTTNYLLGGLSFLTLVGFLLVSKVAPRNKASKDTTHATLTFGSVVFDSQRRQLQIHNETIDLTGTETRLLLILASSPNATIERSRLQKEIWEDEGVIVGRSLDMFISKLRKKLELDPKVNIVVIRGKGYKLEVNE